MLKVIEFINNHNNWKELLSSAPYNIIIKEKGKFVLLKYNNYESDMSNPIVQECRGLIIKEENNQYKVASMRFNKFFNYGQSEAVLLNFPCEASEKIDGSLIGVWYDEETSWHVSTSGNIDAEDAPLKINGYNSYRDVFNLAWGDIDFNILDKECTYIFELVSPYTKIVVPYPETKLYLLSIRNNNTLEEVSRNSLSAFAKSLFNNKVLVPKSISCNNIDEIQSIINDFTYNNENFEGFVLCDNNFNRIKLKSSIYMELFFMKGEDNFSDKKILKTILDEQDDDVLAFFPEYIEAFINTRKKLSNFISYIKNEIKNAGAFKELNRKDFALSIKNMKYKDILFRSYNENIWDKDEEYYFKFLKNYIENLPLSKLLDFMNEEK